MASKITHRICLSFHKNTSREMQEYWYRFLESECIYHAPIDLEQQTDVRLVPNQSENGKYNLISFWLNKTSRRKNRNKNGVFSAVTSENTPNDGETSPAKNIRR